MFRDWGIYAPQRKPCVGACYCTGACMGMKPENKTWLIGNEDNAECGIIIPKPRPEPLPFDELKGQ